MSGTSLDGIDAALIETDGETVAAVGPARTVAYDPALRTALRDALGRRDPEPDTVRRMTDAHADTVLALLDQFPEYKGKIGIVGLHGHTVLHAPRERLTVQIGDGARLAEALGIDVVCDFRAADVAAGGEGAPFAPLYHRALARGLGEAPVAVVNIGGIANVTWVGAPDQDPIAFDTGPGNALLDDWVAATTDLPFDRDGAASRAGHIDESALAVLLDNPYFAARPPKSLDRLDFATDAVRALSAADGAATLARFTVETVVAGLRQLPARPVRLLVTGGGRHNPTLMAGLAALAGIPVAPVEEAGWDGDALEAQAFAFLAVRAMCGLPLSVPTTTGVPGPTTGGRLFRVPV